MPTWVPFWRFYTLQKGPDELLVVCPPNAILILVVTLIVGVPLLRWTLANLRDRKMTVSALVMYLLIYGFCLGLVVSHGTLTLNRQTNTATIHKIHFMYIPTTEQISLNEVESARVESAPHSDHFIVVTRGGKNFDLIYWTQMSGQGHAANAVNAFLSQPVRQGSERSAR